MATLNSFTKTTIQYGYIKISNPHIPDWYRIEEGTDGRFYILSDNGYNGYEGKGHSSLEESIRYAKTMVRNYFHDRCEPNPEGLK